jgi:hypothetical protein
MDKKDAMYGVAALVIILVIALVIKPLATGQPVNIGLPVPGTTTPVTTILPANYTLVTTPVTPVTPVPQKPTPSPTPTPAPTWDASVKSVEFVNSSVYGISPDASLPNGSRLDTLPVNTSMTSFAKITGQFSGTTQIIRIPFPYWQIVYTVEPVAEPVLGTVQAASTRGSGVAYSGVQGSYSGVTPTFTIQVMDADDPNRIVRTINPPGGIDLNLWKGIKNTVNPAVTNVKAGKATTSADVPYNDPRPWTEKFFEGERSYFFIIKAEQLSSYIIDIQVPTKYVGKY